MEQNPLLPLLAPLTSLRGVGDETAKRLEKLLGGGRVLDLLCHLPDDYVDRSQRVPVASALPGAVSTLTVQVLRHDRPLRPGQPWRVAATDGTGMVELVFFRPQRLRQLEPGARVIVSGKLERYGDRLSMPHPDFVVPAEREGSLPLIEPVWPLTAGLTGRHLRVLMEAAAARLPILPEWHDAALMRSRGWPAFADALRRVQCPEVRPADTARARLAYDELLAHQVAMAWTRTRNRLRPGRAMAGDGRLRSAALMRFGHRPTASQLQALAEIDRDLAAPRRMLRLLQGDVGSGKTLVAALAMLRAAEAGAQAALMAPTEVLARQHFRTLSHISPVPVHFLAGSMKAAERRVTLAKLADGSAQLVVGTHALFQDGVDYRDLGLAVIDEQHRFGVEQRLQLGGKGDRTDILVMTATPIPRTLLLTQWGEMEVSRLTEKPAGRQPIHTSIHSLSKLDDVYESVARAVAQGKRIYWVCPLVAESEVVDLAAAEARCAELRDRLGEAVVGLAHGRQPPELREAALAAFKAGDTRVLVATTVIEVGVDVPEATVMVIEHAERFGLAQLHQLRGRVGRGAAQSYCLLLHEDGLGDMSRRRLTLLRETEDGFRIADEDFQIRGGGELLGRRQSGLPGYRLADPVVHDGLLQTARKDAAVLLDRDPRLESERGQAIRLLLRLFDRGAAVRTLASG